MSTAPQLTPENPTTHTRGGPRTSEGKSISSKNAITHGLFATSDFIRPDEHQAYSALGESLRAELAPHGVLELNLAHEIRRTMWRLRRCGQVESNLVLRLNDNPLGILDPMEAANSNAERIQKSVDRARSQAHRLLHKCTAELRKLQMERHLTINAETRAAEATAPQSSFCKPPSAPQNPVPQTPRNAQCPCASGLKYKRCCGKNAPALLHAA